MSTGKRGRGKSMEREPESGDAGAGKTKGGDVEHSKGNGSGWGAVRGGEEEEEAVRGWYSRIFPICSEASKREGWGTGRFGN